MVSNEPLVGFKQWRNYTGLTYHDIHVKLFLPFVRTVVDLINASKSLPSQYASVPQDPIATAFTWCNTLYTVCQGWTEREDRTGRFGVESPKNYLRPVWHHHDRFADRWRPVQTHVQDPNYAPADEVLLCSDSPPPPIQPIQVDALLAAYGNGPPLEWRGPRQESDNSPGAGFAGTGQPFTPPPPASQP